MAKATCYLQLVAELERDYRSRDPKAKKVREIKVARLTQSPPDKPLSGAQVVALELEVDDEVFLPWSPKAVVKISVGDRGPIVVQALPKHARSRPSGLAEVT